jgi:excisionase family DNA binding protein
MDGSARTAVDPEAEALELLRQAVGLLLDARRRREPVAEPLVDAAELARYLSLPVSWIESAAREGSIPCYRAGRWTRFRASEVEATLRAEAGPR